MTDQKYDVALSFASEERKIAEALAKAIKALGFKVFYDGHEKAMIWGKNLFEYLNDIYFKRARLCVILVSESYANRIWTNHERRSAQARALQQTEEYILPIRIDNTDLPGFPNTIAYLQYTDHSIDEIATLIAAKLTGSTEDFQIPTCKPGADYYLANGAIIPEPEISFDLPPSTTIQFHVETGKISDLRGLGDDQEIWLISNGREIGLNIRDSLIRVRKGHFVSYMTVAPNQPYPNFIVAAINYTTHTLTLSTKEIRFLAAATLTGKDSASKALARAGKLALGRAFIIAFIALFLAVLITDWKDLHTFIFLATFALAALEPYIIQAGIDARVKLLNEFISKSYGYSPPEN